MPEFKEPDHQAVRELLYAMTGRRVLVVGDGMIDAYIYGTSSRISPEAPVPIVQIEREEQMLGGAANVAKCLVALGAKVTLACVVGDDAAGRQFVDEAQSLKIDTRLVLKDARRCTTVKQRVISGRQQLIRIDRENSGPYSDEILAKLSDEIRKAAADSDAVLLSDYNKGVLTEAVCRAAIDAAKNRPVIVDPKGIHWPRYRGATVLKPNLREAAQFSGSECAAADDAAAEKLAHSIREKVGVQNVLMTRGQHGFTLVGQTADKNVCSTTLVGQTFSLPLSLPSRAVSVKDEAGAGDVFAAALSLALSTGATPDVAAWLGNVAASVKVGKFGTLSVSDYEILEALGERFPSSKRKLLTLPQAAELAANLRNSSKKVVFTNGCFDVLHLGHVTYLEDARQLGDALIVGINTDESVRRLKGPERPINLESDRARVIASQECVDGVVLFGEDTPLDLIKAIKPDVLCKGADYKRKQDVVGWDVVESYGGRVALIDLVEGRSSSNVINKLRGTA